MMLNRAAELLHPIIIRQMANEYAPNYLGEFGAFFRHFPAFAFFLGFLDLWIDIIGPEVGTVGAIVSKLDLHKEARVALTAWLAWIDFWRSRRSVASNRVVVDDLFQLQHVDDFP